MFGTTIEVLPVVRIDDQHDRPRVDRARSRDRLARRACSEELARWLDRSRVHLRIDLTTDDEASDDPFAEHLRRDPLPDAGIRIIVLTDIPREACRSDRRVTGGSGRGARAARRAIASLRSAMTGLAVHWNAGSREPACRWCW